MAEMLRQQLEHKEDGVFGDEFGYEYYEQRQAERLQAAEKARLIHSLEQARRTERREARREAPWRKRVLTGVGQRLVAAGTRLQQAAAHNALS